MGDIPEEFCNAHKRSWKIIGRSSYAASMEPGLWHSLSLLWSGKGLPATVPWKCSKTAAMVADYIKS